VIKNAKIIYNTTRFVFGIIYPRKRSYNITDITGGAICKIANKKNIAFFPLVDFPDLLSADYFTT